MNDVQVRHWGVADVTATFNVLKYVVRRQDK